jgi:hypothetical protein
MALKGVPLVVAAYHDWGLRPMADSDVLVDPADLGRAIEAIEGAGWCRIGELPGDLDGRAEVAFRAPRDDVLMDLHWRLKPWVTPDPRRDPALWAAAAPIRIGAGSMLAPAPHDLALHVVLHAFRSHWERVVRWVPDLVLLLRCEGPAFDWDTFIARAVAGQLAAPVHSALEYVRTTFDAPVPGPVLADLGARPPTRRQAHKLRVAAMRPSVSHQLLGGWPRLRSRWARVSVNYSRRRAFQEFPAYVGARTNVAHVSMLPFVAVARRFHRRPPPQAGDDGANDSAGPAELSGRAAQSP